MKVTPSTPHLDRCQTSITVLADRIRSHLLECHQIENPWFVDDSTQFFQSSEDCVDIVFFGGFLKRFLESGNWNFSSFRFWVLSESVAKVLSKTIGLPLEKINILPRQLIHPPRPEFRNIGKLGGSETLVYAGRLSPEKNISLLIWTFHYLQKEHFPDLKLKLFGSFDNSAPFDLGRMLDRDYQREIEELVAELEWTTAPEFCGHLAPDEWIECEISDPIYISLSTFIQEDYGVSLAQAQEKGWPSIVTNWGGQADLYYGAQILLAPLLAGNEYEPQALRKARGYRYSQLIASSTFEKNILKDGGLKTPAATLTRSELEKVRLEFVERYDPEIQLAFQGKLADFADTPKGRLFFDHYARHFDCSDSKDFCSIIVNDFHLSDDLSLKYCLELCAQMISCGVNYRLIPFRHLAEGQNLKYLMASAKITIPFVNENTEELIVLLKKKLHLTQPLEIYANIEQELTVLDEAEPFIAAEDRIYVFDPEKLKKLLPGEDLLGCIDD